MRVLIVDDEPFAREELRFLLQEYSDCEVIGEAGDGPNAVESIEKMSPDLVLLDIQMPGMNGFETLRALTVGSLPHFVFVTAYDRYAIQAFEVSAVDYLLKPVAAERLAKSLERCRVLIGATAAAQSGEAYMRQMKSLLASLPQQRKYARQLVGRKRERIYLIPVEDIFSVEMENQLVVFHTVSDRYWTNDTLTDVIARLDPEFFQRVHRQGVVRLDAIHELAPITSERLLLRLKNGRELTVSRNYLSELRSRLGMN